MQLLKRTNLRAGVAVLALAGVLLVMSAVAQQQAGGQA